MSYIIFERIESRYSVTMNRRKIITADHLCTCETCRQLNADVRAPFWGPESNEYQRRLTGMAIVLELMRNSGVQLTPNQQILSAGRIATWLETMDADFQACSRMTFLENCRLNHLIKAGLHKVKEVARG